MKDRQPKLLVSSRLILAAITSLLLNGAQARTWTSADGTKTFEGELKSYDPKIAVITVALSNGKSMHCEQDKLSAADIAYLKTYFEENPTTAAPLSSAVNLKDIPDVWPPNNEKPYGGKRLGSNFSAELKSLKDEISRALPKVGGKGFSDLENAGKATAAAAAKADAAQKDYGQIGAAKGGIDHANGKWIGGANKNIATAQAALKSAKTPAEREAAESQLNAAQKDLAAGEAALKERTALYDAAKAKEPALKRA